jgi:hypothetical protein
MVTNTPVLVSLVSKIGKLLLTCEPERDYDKRRPIHDEPKGLVLYETEIGRDDPYFGGSDGACV